MIRKRVIVSVTNDLTTDQRVRRVCQTLYENGFDIILVGRKLKNSLELDPRQYKCVRFKLFFNKNFLFYAEFNLRLFFFLLFKKFDILHSNDLDTLLPNIIVGKIKRKPVVYDSHELFCEAPELINRRFVKKTWEFIEKMTFPYVTMAFTVNQSIADYYYQKYRKEIRVLRNVPFRLNVEQKLTRTDFKIPEDKKVVILQGAGINIDRGAEEAVLAMKYLNENFFLVIAGGGDVIPSLKELVKNENLTHRVMFIPRMPYDKYVQLTRLADVGLSLDKDTNLNYRYSLPNKIFDYIQAHIPIVASCLPEVKNIIENYNVGICIPSHNPQDIARCIEFVLIEKGKSYYAENLEKASYFLCWEFEKYILIDNYEKLK